MKLPFKREKIIKANQKEGELIELSLEEQQAINGGGWMSQSMCDAYHACLARGDTIGAAIYKAYFYS